MDKMIELITVEGDYKYTRYIKLKEILGFLSSSGPSYQIYYVYLSNTSVQIDAEQFYKLKRLLYRKAEK